MKRFFFTILFISIESYSMELPGQILESGDSSQEDSAFKTAFVTQGRATTNSRGSWTPSHVTEFDGPRDLSPGPSLGTTDSDFEKPKESDLAAPPELQAGLRVARHTFLLAPIPEVKESQQEPLTPSGVQSVRLPATTRNTETKRCWLLRILSCYCCKS